MPLRYQALYKGAKPNEAAAKEWKKHKIILDFGNAMHEAQSGRSPLSEQQQETLFADMEAKLLELEK